MKVVVPLLLVAVALLGWGLSLEVATNRRQQTQIDELRTKLAEPPKRDAFEMTEKCAAQSERAFKAQGYKELGGASDYKTHYNSHLGKCFMTVSRTDRSGGILSEDRVLLDAFEQREYGSYSWISDIHRKDGRPLTSIAPMICQVTNPEGGADQTCGSEAEYKALVARYMDGK